MSTPHRSVAMPSRPSRSLLATILGLAVASTALAQDDAHVHGAPSRLGTVVFPNSGAKAAQPAFLRGIALLHSFVYDQAASAFEEAENADRNFPLPYWFEALTHSPVLWGIDDPAGARKALARLGPTPSARLDKAKTPRERAYGA